MRATKTSLLKLKYNPRGEAFTPLQTFKENIVPRYEHFYFYNIRDLIDGGRFEFL